jgi:AhpD family alkylhydroperoxidase
LWPVKGSFQQNVQNPGYQEVHMATVGLVEYENASAEVKAVFDDIKQTRNVEDVNNFWKAIANHPETLKRIWESLREIMKPGALDALTKEMIYVAVSITNSCDYCIHTHTAAAFGKGMTEEQYQELLAVVAMAHQTNALATGMKVPVDAQFSVDSES